MEICKRDEALTNMLLKDAVREIVAHLVVVGSRIKYIEKKITRHELEGR